ncbi:MAG: hypothetical protein GXP31_10685 [Kiritimatiellaeota bacterium]|nr:hypothetical protein [Kiritimatiellota bacterium]
MLFSDLLARVSLSVFWCAAFGGPAGLAQLSGKTADGLSLRSLPGSGITAAAVDGKVLPSGETHGGLFVSEVKEQTEELLSNGSLGKDDDGDGVPDGFRSTGKWVRDNRVARTGRWSAKAEIPGKQDGMSGSFGVLAPVEGGSTCMASFWLKCRGRGGRYPAGVGYLQQQNQDGERTTGVFQQMMSGGVSGTADWTRVWMLLTTEGDTRQLCFRADIYHGHGTLWVDDFSLKKIAAAVKVPTRAIAAGDDVRLVGDGGTCGRLARTLWPVEPTALLHCPERGVRTDVDDRHGRPAGRRRPGPNGRRQASRLGSPRRSGRSFPRQAFSRSYSGLPDRMVTR